MSGLTRWFAGIDRGDWPTRRIGSDNPRSNFTPTDFITVRRRVSARRQGFLARSQIMGTKPPYEGRTHLRVPLAYVGDKYSNTFVLGLTTP